MDEQKIIIREGLVMKLLNGDVVKIVNRNDKPACVDLCYFSKVCMLGQNNRSRKLVVDTIYNAKKYKWNDFVRGRGCFLKPGLYFEKLEGGM